VPSVSRQRTHDYEDLCQLALGWIGGGSRRTSKIMNDFVRFLIDSMSCK